MFMAMTKNGRAQSVLQFQIGETLLIINELFIESQETFNFFANYSNCAQVFHEQQYEYFLPNIELNSLIDYYQKVYKRFL